MEARRQTFAASTAASIRRNTRCEFEMTDIWRECKMLLLPILPCHGTRVPYCQFN